MIAMFCLVMIFNCDVLPTEQFEVVQCGRLAGETTAPVAGFMTHPPFPPSNTHHTLIAKHIMKFASASGCKQQDMSLALKLAAKAVEVLIVLDDRPSLSTGTS